MSDCGINTQSKKATEVNRKVIKNVLTVDIGFNSYFSRLKYKGIPGYGTRNHADL